MLAAGQQCFLSPHSLSYLQLASTSRSQHPKCYVLHVDQDFINGSASGVLRVATTHTQDVHGQPDPVLELRPQLAVLAGITDASGGNF